MKMHSVVRLLVNPRFQRLISTSALKFAEPKRFSPGNASSTTSFRPFIDESRSDDETDPILVPPTYPGFRPMRLPNGGKTLAEIESNVDRMLDDFRNRRNNGNTSTMRHATYLCNITGRFEEFLQVIDEWFRQVRPLLDESPYFKVGSNLCNLGKLNRCTNGRVISRLEWGPIDYFIQRMFEMGFHRFHAEDVGSALAGLHDLIFFTDPRPDRMEIDDSIDAWLRTFEKYLMEKQRNDFDWSVLIGEIAPLSLNYLKGLDSCGLPIFTRHRSLIETLFRLSKLGFDEILEEFAANRANEKKSEVYDSGIMVFAQACIYFDLDPEQIAPGIWKSWHDCYLKSLHHRSLDALTFFDHGYVLQIAGKYPHFRSSHFWPKFDIWYVEVIESIRQFMIEPASTANSYTKAAALLYNTSTLLKLARDDNELQTRKYEFRVLASLFDQVLSSATFDSRPSVWKKRIACSFLEFNQTVDWVATSEKALKDHVTDGK